MFPLEWNDRGSLLLWCPSLWEKSYRVATWIYTKGPSYGAPPQLSSPRYSEKKERKNSQGRPAGILHCLVRVYSGVLYLSSLGLWTLSSDERNFDTARFNIRLTSPRHLISDILREAGFLLTRSCKVVDELAVGNYGVFLWSVGCGDLLVNIIYPWCELYI
jgi:hypothetical protein